MPYFSAQTTTATALANGNAIMNLVLNTSPQNAKITSIVLGCNTGSTAISDFDITVGLNRATARGTSTGTATVTKLDTLTAATGLTAVDTAWNVQPTLAASDSWVWSYNSRGGLVLNFQPWEVVGDGTTAHGLCLVQRSGAALPTGHAITATVEWFE